MSSAEPPRGRVRPMWVRIALWSFLSFGLLFTFVGALVMFATLRHTTNDYHEVLVRLSGDLTQEYEECGGDAAKMAKFFAENSETHGHENVFLLVTDSDGAVKVSSTHNKTILEEMVENAASKSRTYRIAGVSADGIRPIAVRVRKSRLGDGCVLSVGYNVTKDELHAVRMGALVGSSLVFVWLVGAGLGAFLGQRFTAPLRKVAAVAGRIADGDYSARVPVTSEGQEIVDLENAFNSMAAENEKTLSDLRALTDDIAHDLRTPLTRIRAAAETAALAEGEHPLAEDVCEEASSMLEMINTMLDISQTDSRIRRTPREQIEMVAFVGHVIELYSVLAEESSVSLSATMPDAPLYVSAHKGRLQQMLGNLDAREPSRQRAQVHPEGRQDRGAAFVGSVLAFRRKHGAGHPRVGHPARLQALLARRRQQVASGQRTRPRAREGNRDVLRREREVRVHAGRMDGLHRHGPVVA